MCSRGFSEVTGRSIMFHEVLEVFQRCPMGHQGVSVAFHGVPDSLRGAPEVFKGFQGCTRGFQGIPAGFNWF